jgi:hypothetical protein
MTDTVRLFTATCFGSETTWDGYPAVRCSGSYRPVDIGKVGAATLAELGIQEFAKAIQNVLIVRLTPVNIVIVDAIALKKKSLALGTVFVESFHVLQAGAGSPG